MHDSPPPPGTLALDGYDLKLLAAIQEDGRASHVALADKVALSPSQCSRRLARLEADGTIAGYRAALNPQALGYGVEALVSVSLERHGESPADAFHAAVAGFPEILDCWLVTGDSDYVLRVVAPDLKRFSDFLLVGLMRLPGVANVRSSIVLDRIGPAKGLPLPSRPTATGG